MTDQVAPKPGSRWKHKNGTVYKVILLANLDTTRPNEYPPTVVYSSPDWSIWSRPLARWHKSMKLVRE